MEFTKQFSEASQAAILRKVEADQWENLPWLAKLVQENIRQSLAHPATMEAPKVSGPDIDEAISILELEWSKKPEPLDSCGCEIGRCTCTDQMLEKVAKKCDVNPGVLKAFADFESANNKQPIGGIVETADGVFGQQKPDDSFESNDFSHVDGYDYRIIVADRMKRHENSWAEHFNYRPTQEEFENQFRHFHARTHYVHVNQWIDGDWITITGDYVPHWNKEKPVETFTATDEWPEGKTYRIKFWDQRVTGFNYVYFERKPGGIVLNKYHNAKCFAVVQARPEGV